MHGHLSGCRALVGQDPVHRRFVASGGAVSLARERRGPWRGAGRQENDVRLYKRDLGKKLLNRTVERLAARAGRVLYKPHLLWLLDPSWRRPYERYLQLDARKRRSALRIIDRRFTVVQMAASVRKLSGSTAECGVRRGVGSALICTALQGTYDDAQRHFGFDSFEGLAEPTEEDRSRWGDGLWWRKGELSNPIDVAQANLEGFPFCQLVRGWIPQCFAPAADHRFRFVHIDVDLHDATRDSLAFFYPRLVNGAVILLDDYGLASCPGARTAAQEFFADKPEPIVELATGQAFVIKGP